MGLGCIIWTMTVSGDYSSTYWSIPRGRYSYMKSEIEVGHTAINSVGATHRLCDVLYTYIHLFVSHNFTINESHITDGELMT